MLRRAGLACLALSVVLLTGWSVPLVAQANRGDLARARLHYNQREFDQAIAAATAARRASETADAAAIVLARAHLERYRERADPTDLSAARVALGLVRASELEPRDEVELLLALGESLFLEDDFGAAAEIFESGLERAADVDDEIANAMLDWWGSAIERQVTAYPPETRRAAFARLLDRTRAELAADPSSSAASYWTVVALRGTGELNRAWDAAVAAWVRARLSGVRAPELRADLDRLVLQGLVPDRVRHVAADRRTEAESQLKADWELVKEKWK